MKVRQEEVNISKLSLAVSVPPGLLTYVLLVFAAVTSSMPLAGKVLTVAFPCTIVAAG